MRPNDVERARHPRATSSGTFAQVTASRRHNCRLCRVDPSRTLTCDYPGTSLPLYPAIPPPNRVRATSSATRTTRTDDLRRDTAMTEHDTCGWCGQPLDDCTRCRECGSHGSIVDGACGVCGAITDEQAYAARTTYADAIGAALEPDDETTVHVPLDASTALEILRALDRACGTGYVEGETRAVLLGTLGAIRDGVIAAGVEVPAYVYLRTVK